MAELWKNLIEKEDPSLAETLTLSRVSISQKTGEMRIRFRSEHILSDAQFELVQRLISSAFPQVRVKIQMEYPHLRDAIRSDISIASGLMKALVRHESPGSMPFIDWNGNGWSLTDDILTVCVSSPEGAAYLKSRKVDRILADKMNDLFGMNVSVRINVTGDEERRIQQIAEARAREEELLAKSMSQPSASAKKAPPPRK